jgi:ferredoxin
MQIEVDPELCEACGICVDICPEVFELNGALITVKIQIVPARYWEACEVAVEECPVGAMFLRT